MSTDELKELFQAALDAVDPAAAVSRNLSRSGRVLTVAGRSYDLQDYDRILVVGAGKATARMAVAVEAVLGGIITGGLIIVKYGHTAPLRRIGQIEAGHPVPDRAGVEATQKVVELLRKADRRTLVLCLLSGGGSALLVAPVHGLSLAAKQRTTELLLASGAAIEELNAVRKHLSAVKGGRLAKIACPATVAALIISDVLQDRLDVIASGPTAPDPGTFADAVAVMDRYGLRQLMPGEAVAYLERGAAGGEEETAKERDDCFATTHNAVVAGLDQAIDAAMLKARSFGTNAELVTRALRGEACDAARSLAKRAIQARSSLAAGERKVLLSGGETTVTVKGTGRGGRNQELALAFAIEIGGEQGITLLSAGTDGTDGPTDAAGAIVDGETVRRAAEQGLVPGDFLVNNDSYSFFQRLDAATGAHAHFKTGPTGTNVMDLQAIIVEEGPFRRGAPGQGARYT